MVAIFSKYRTMALRMAVVAFALGLLLCSQAMASKFLPSELDKLAPKMLEAKEYLKQGRYDEAADLARKRISLDPDDWSAYLLLSLSYLGKGDDKSAWNQAAEIEKQSPQYSAAIYSSLGRFYSAKQRRFRALQAYQRALEIEDAATQIEGMGAIYLIRGQLEKAKIYYVRLQKFGAGDIDLARISMAQKDFKKAIQYARKAIEKKNDRVTAELVLASSLLMDGQFEASGKVFSAIKEKKEKFFLPYDMLGLIYLCRMLPDKTIQVCNEALKIAPKMKELHLKKAVAYHLLGDYDNALDSIGEALDADPSDALTNLAKANIHFSRKEMGKAAQSLNRAGLLYPDFSRENFNASQYFNSDDANAFANFTLSNIFFREGLFSKTIELTQALSKMMPHNPFIAVTQARAEFQMGHVDRARQNYLDLIKTSPECIAAYLELGELEYKEKNFPAAIDVYTKAADRFPNQQRINWGLGEFYYQAEKIDQSIDAFRKIIEADSGFSLGYNQLAWIYAEKKGDLNKSLAYAKKAFELSPQNAKIADTLGWIYYKKGKLKEALECYESIKNNVKFPEFYLHLGTVQKDMQRMADAVQSFEKALDITDDFKEYDETRRMLLSISGY